MAEDERLTSNHRNNPKVIGGGGGEWRRGPRNVRLVRCENGFGFTLRHFIVYPPESYQVLARDRRLGLRLCEGRTDEPMDTIFVKSVRAGSAADVAGLCTGDRILGVNGEPTVHRPYHDVVSLIQASRDHLSLLVVSKEEDLIQLYFGDTAHKSETNPRPQESLRSPELVRSSVGKHPALSAPRRSLDAMPHPSSSTPHHHPHLHHPHHHPVAGGTPAVAVASTSLDYDPRLLDPSSSPLTTPGSRLSLDGGSPSRDSRESSVNSVHSSDDSVIISRIFKSCEKKEEFLRRPVVWSHPSAATLPPDRQYVRRVEEPAVVWPSAIPASMVAPAKPPSPGPFICGGPVSNPPSTSTPHSISHHRLVDPAASGGGAGGAARFVSERARQFETGQCQPDKTVLYKSELARLAQTNSGSNVAVRRREFESRADWRSHRESRSLDSNTSNSSLSQRSTSACSSTPMNTPAGTPVQQLSGNRTIPVGGTRLHCEPPSSADYRPTSLVSEKKEVRPRSNSLGAAVPLDKSSAERRRNKAVRQDSYLAAVKKVAADDERSTRRESYIKATTTDGGTVDTMDQESDSDTAATYRIVSNHLPPCDKEVTIDGSLAFKINLLEGKKWSDRSWRSVWAVLIGHILFLFKDKKDPVSKTPIDYECVDLDGMSVSQAEDYSKRKHVLKLSTNVSDVCSKQSEMLLQAESSGDMSRWIQALHHDNNNTQSLSGVESSSSGSKSSGLKLAPFRNRSPPGHQGHSPTTKSRKPSQSDGGSGAKGKSLTWKVRLADGLKFKKSVSPVQYPEYPEGATIGVPLDLCPQSKKEYVPLLVEMCTKIVEAKGLDIIGIYRVPGNTAAVTSLTEAVNRGLDTALLDEDQRWSDVNVISSLLKSFFRKLPDCLLTTQLYPQFIEADKIDLPKRRVAELRNLVHELPPHNKETLKHLLFHLKTVVSKSNVNKMEAKNLAIVFGPTLIKAGDNSMATLVNDMSHQCRIVETLILYVDWCFSDESIDKLVLKDDTLHPPEVHETDVTNQSLLLNNIHKVEGLKESPTKDLSAKDIMSSIISAANRKMQKARRGKSIAFIAEESLPHHESTSSETSKHREERLGTEESGREFVQYRHRHRDAGSLPTVASHVRQSILFSNSVTSKLLSQINSSQSDKESEEEKMVGGDDREARTEAANPECCTVTGGQVSVEGGTIRSYTGLQQVTQERVRRFELETKAMLQRENHRKREEVKSNTSLAAIEQSIALSKEAVDNSGKRLKTCQQVRDGGGAGGGGIRKGSLDSLKDNSWCSEWKSGASSETEKPSKCIKELRDFFENITNACI